jgi:hypothetical protein
MEVFRRKSCTMTLMVTDETGTPINVTLKKQDVCALGRYGTARIGSAVLIGFGMNGLRRPKTGKGALYPSIGAFVSLFRYKTVHRGVM